MKLNFNERNGITLIALVITVVVLLILAGVAILTLTGENGILTKAGNAKQETEIGKEKEIIKLAILATKKENITQNLEKEELQKELNALAGDGKTETTYAGENIEVYFKESKRYYEVDKEGNIGNYQVAVEVNNPGDITKGGILDGSEEKPYEINCIEDLVAFSNMVNGSGIKLVSGTTQQVTTDDINKMNGKKVILKRTLNFKSKYSYENSKRTDFGDINGNDADGNEIMTEMTTEMGFKPIGVSYHRAFSGTFDGKENSIQNLFIDDPNVKDDVVGLFSRVSPTTGTIKNLTVTGEIKSKGYYASGIVGWGGYCIENCVNKANVEGTTYVGGINGKEANRIINCKNTGNILITKKNIADGGAGGISGSSALEIINCQNEGTVKGDTIGGIVGCLNSNSIINNCCNKGKIGTEEYSNYEIGGILGYHRGGRVTIVNCKNQGDILGKGNQGGIVGTSIGASSVWEMEIAICNSYNIGKIESNNGYSGGIIGMYGGGSCKKYYGFIENVWNVGEVSGIYAGGIVGVIPDINNTQEETDVKREIKTAYCTSQTAIYKGTDYTGETTKKTIEEMRTQEFVDLLNGNIEENIQWNRWRFVMNQFPEFE